MPKESKEQKRKTDSEKLTVRKRVLRNLTVEELTHVVGGDGPTGDPGTGTPSPGNG